MPEPPDRDNAAYVRRVHDKGLRFDLRTTAGLTIAIDPSGTETGGGAPPMGGPDGPPSS